MSLAVASLRMVEFPIPCLWERSTVFCNIAFSPDHQPANHFVPPNFSDSARPVFKFSSIDVSTVICP